MTVSEIIKAVRWCIDEETNNTSDMADVIDDKEDSYMDNIIRAKINDALHWVSATASASSILADSKSVGGTGTTSTLAVQTYDADRNIGAITLPDDVEIINVSRVRVDGWQKAVVPVEDTDDEALMMFDDSAFGTADRPQATILRENPIRVLIQPSATTATISYVGVPKSVETSDGSTEIDIPEKLRNSVIYYIAFLLLSAYDDTKANQMYTIALQQLGASTSKTD